MAHVGADEIQDQHKSNTTGLRPCGSACPRRGQEVPWRARPGSGERRHPRVRPRFRACGGGGGVRDSGVPAGGGGGAVAGGVHRERAAAVPAGDDRGGAGRQAGEGHRPAAGRGAGHGAARRGPDRALPGPRPAAGGKRWSRRHADTQRRLCQRFAAPVIAGVTCQDITPVTCSRSSAPRRPPARASGCTGACRPW